MGGEKEQPAQPDPTLVQETAQAQVVDTQQIQQSLGVDQQNLWNMFGNGSQLSYVQLPGASGGQTAIAPGATSNVTGAPAAGGGTK